MRLKADLHLHTGDDPRDYVIHSNKEMIDHAAELGFEILAITNHDFMSHREELADYAAARVRARSGDEHERADSGEQDAAGELGRSGLHGGSWMFPWLTG